MISTLCRAIVVAMAFAIGACSWMEPSTKAASPSLEQQSGEAIYRRYCGACHGLAAKGDGIVSQLMTPKPRDLTSLTREFGKFPREWLIRVIDGRETVRAHGDSDMPVWGANLCDPLGPDVSDTEIRNWIVAVVDHLESIQE